MLRRVSFALNLLAIALGWFCASQIWATAELIDTPNVITASGTDSYPQLTFIFSTGLVMLWLARYFNSIFSKFLASAVLALMVSTSLPVLFDASSGSLSILSPQITKVSGISDWLAQTQLITHSVYNSTAADITLICVMICFLTSLVLLWTKKPGQTKKQFTTRIDNLPSW